MILECVMMGKERSLNPQERRVSKKVKQKKSVEM